MNQTNDDPFKADVLRWMDEYLPEKYRDSQGKEQSVWRVHYERNFAIGFSVVTVVNAQTRQSWLFGWGKNPEVNNEYKDPDQSRVKELVAKWRKEVKSDG